ncbi:MAG: site-specific DNA-methyltransferase [Dysgonamonadaceae bacterium]
MNIDKLDLQSLDLVNENIEKLAVLFPNCVTESAKGKAIDFDLLKQELSHAVVEGNRERYRLEWPGKREAIVTANLPTTQTLRPVREDSVDFDTTENLYIEGDNLEVLKLLQESYFGKVKMIYIDPPYNTGKDFVYRDNFTGDAATELLESGQIDELNQRLVANPETSGRYHSDWLSMMYPRLKLARNLLTDDGVIFISIDDNEVHNLRKVCDEVFGEGNSIGVFTRKTKSGGGSASDSCAVEHDYVICYARSLGNSLPLLQNFGSDYLKRYKEQDNVGYFFWDTMERSSTKTRPYKIIAPDGSELTGKWFRSEETFKSDLETGEVRFLKKSDGWSVQFKQRLADGKKLRTILETEDLTNKQYRSLSEELENIVGCSLGHPPKPVTLMKTLINSIDCTNNNIILDFFSGSATTAHAVMQLNAEDGGNRKYIMVQLPEQTDEKSEAYKAGYSTICEIGKERIRRAGKKIKEEKRAKAEKAGMFANFEDTQDYGFRVYRLDSSNMEDVYYRPQDYKQETLDMFANNIKPDRSADDLLSQVMLDWGLPLSYSIESVSINGKQVFKVAQNSLFACFDQGIDEAFAKEIAKEKPLRVVFRDNGFANDTAKINVQQLLKQLSPETEMKVI